MTSGCAIYEVKLQPHSSRYTATIAGPHHSFNMLAGAVGNVSHLLNQFIDGLKKYKRFGPAAPKSIGMTDAEYELAYQFNRGQLTTGGMSLDDLNDVEPDQTTKICTTHGDLSYKTPVIARTNPPELMEDDDEVLFDGLEIPLLTPSKSERDHIVTDTRDDFY